MARDPKHDVLFEPIAIGPKVLKNRFFQVAQCSGARHEYPGFQAHHRGIKAEGGWAGVCTESTSIDPSTDGAWSNRLWDEGDIRNLAAMTEYVHSFDALAMVELRHGGTHSHNSDTRDVPMSVTGIASMANYTLHPRAMDLDDIKAARRMYVDAALRAREAGFDMIDIYGGHTQLPFQFLSPFWNRRTDEYGGSFDNRARFWYEVLRDVREAVGDDLAIAARLSLDELRGPDGHGIEDGLRFLEKCNDVVDLWDLVVGGLYESGQNSAPSRFFESNQDGPFVGRAKAGNHTDKPVMGVGRYTDPDLMAALVRDGGLDVIGAARPAIADPFIPQKIAEGRLEDIRECIGCNQCVSTFERGTRIVCTQNATAGEEYRRGWHPEKFTKAINHDKSVLVVGAGPAGLECAMVLGKRGMEAVHVVDADSVAGGSLNWISLLGKSNAGVHSPRGAARGLTEWRRVIDYRMAQIGKLPNVEFFANIELTAEQVLDYGADIVVIATGSHFAADGLNPVTQQPISGVDTDSNAWQLTPRDVALGNGDVGERVVVYDTDGYYMGASLAQKLASDGHQVRLVTPAGDATGYLNFTLEAPMMRRDLAMLGVEIQENTVLDSVEPGLCHTSDVWSGRRADIEVDTLVMCTSRIADRALYDDLRADQAKLDQAGISGPYLIGSASAPRMIYHSVYDGHRLAREIDTRNPAVPLPYIRERRLWGQTTNADYDGQLRLEPQVRAAAIIG